MSQRIDLSTAPKLELDWTPIKSEESLNEVFHYGTSLADQSIEWYVSAKKAKQKGARRIRIASIILGALAALFPTIVELTAANGQYRIGAGWTTVILGVAGALLLLDRFFGYSSAWMRYIVAELQLRQINQEFQMDWETERASWQGSSPSKEQITQMLARSKAFISQVNTIIREETNVWVQEFQNTIKYLDDSIKAKPAVTEPGALNLTITNPELAAEGWLLSINGGKQEHYTGSTAGKRNIFPGKHLIKVTAKVKDKEVEVEKVVTVPVGGICEEKITLS